MNKKVFKIVLMTLNVLVIVFLVGYICYMHYSTLKKNKLPSVTSQAYTEEELQAAMAKAEENMMSIYGNLLPGSKATFSDGNTMSFLSDGVFNGYFDANNTAITGTYLVVPSDDEYLANVNIYNGKSYVQYKLMYDENREFMLYYPSDKVYVPLEY